MDARRGVMSTFVDGLLFAEEEGLEAELLTLRTRLVVLGGGKQAQARGGGLRRILVHDHALGKEGARIVSEQCHKDIKGKQMVVFLVPKGCDSTSSGKVKPPKPGSDDAPSVSMAQLKVLRKELEQEHTVFMLVSDADLAREAVRENLKRARCAVANMPATLQGFDAGMAWCESLRALSKSLPLVLCSPAAEDEEEQEDRQARCLKSEVGAASTLEELRTLVNSANGVKSKAGPAGVEGDGDGDDDGSDSSEWPGGRSRGRGRGRRGRRGRAPRRSKKIMRKPRAYVD